MANDNNQENIPPPPPLVRQETGMLQMPIVEPANNPTIVQFENDPLLLVHGQFNFSPMPNGLNGYTEEDYENLMRNNGWWVDLEEDNEFEQEEFPDSDSDSDDEDPPALVS